MRRLWVLTAAFLLSQSITGQGRAADGPSFDCAKAASPIEKRICADPDLAARDRSLAAAYQHLLDVSGPRHRRVTLSQWLWLRQRTRECPPAAGHVLTTCLAESYESRESTLNYWTTGIRERRHPDPSDMDIISQAFAVMADNPAMAEKILRAYDTPRAKIGLAMILRLATPRPAAHETEIRALLIQASTKPQDARDDAEGPDAIPWEFLTHLADTAAGYRGDIHSLIPFIQLAGHDVELPCAWLKRNPELLDGLEKEIYSGIDRFTPSASCPDPEFPASFQKLNDMVLGYDGGYFAGCGMSNPLNTIRSWMTSKLILISQVAPRYWIQKERAVSKNHQRPWLLNLADVPLQGWSTLGTWNHAQYQQVREQFLATRQDLARYYQHAFALPEGDALEAAHSNLISNFWWAIAGGPPINVAIMDADAKPSLADLLAAGEPVEVKGEPLLSLAVVRPEAITPLLAAHAPVDAVNPMGKTPLMTAAQFNSLDAAQLLLKAGAAVNLQSLAPEAIEDNSAVPDSGALQGCAPYHITHGQRTALMYAAANAGLPVIQALLAAGADTTPRDSQGATALDYLEGRGPVPANPLLTGDERETARRLLAPPAH
ncbi:ankyrin repeat domain-containing protein [Azospirillum sp. B4]|uniref:ankyrin repeat domain-containing protein n=1 Tax=Azospirillum sp. B4 TaxID=95605 RepID=UPI00034BFF05|nr:ankyrin repeat domain-containing protein [Azospirillum sp. B4]